MVDSILYNYKKNKFNLILHIHYEVIQNILINSI